MIRTNILGTCSWNRLNYFHNFHWCINHKNSNWYMWRLWIDDGNLLAVHNLIHVWKFFSRWTSKPLEFFKTSCMFRCVLHTTQLLTMTNECCFLWGWHFFLLLFTQLRANFCEGNQMKIQSFLSKKKCVSI